MPAMSIAAGGPDGHEGANRRGQGTRRVTGKTRASRHGMQAQIADCGNRRAAGNPANAGKGNAQATNPTAYRPRPPTFLKAPTALQPQDEILAIP